MKNTLLQDLIKLTIKKDYTLIRETLNKKQPNKGKIFEEYLAELYNGNGFVAYVTKESYDKGADVICYNPNNLERPIFVIQAKNCNAPLDFNQCSNIRSRFESETYKTYGCSKGIIISLNGFRRQPAEKQITDIQLESFKFIEKLIDNYKINNVNGNIIFNNIDSRITEIWHENFSEVKDLFELEWYKTYEELLNYNLIFGNTLVPRNHTNKKLYYWTINMRQDNKHGLLDGDNEGNLKKNCLNKIGFIWDVNQYNWNKKYTELLQLKKQFKTINIPQQHPYQELNKWANTQRNLKKKMH
ncbi:restriction endonuclease [Clostridium estertheticum]|uniref:restriction endonuclease n=1 Tax=Clostridium estertheticum TaxID=238834 RepID=UPI001CF1D28F|nr:restriction endonuclease [Clostridium estertheticum]MCB2362197.1 Helicase associated domain protein [Clostridium estertheticum]